MTRRRLLARLLLICAYFLSLFACFRLRPPRRRL